MRSKSHHVPVWARGLAPALQARVLHLGLLSITDTQNQGEERDGAGR